MLASRGAGWHDGAVKTGLADEVDFDGGVATGVVDLTGVDLGDGHGGGDGGSGGR